MLTRTLDKNQTSEYTKIQSGTQGARGRSTGDGGTKNTNPPPGTGRGLGCWSRPDGGGAGVRVMDSGRGRKGPLDGINMWSTRTWEQVEEGKGGKPEDVRQAWIA